MFKRSFILVFVFMLWLPANAQYVSKHGNFKVSEKSGCAPFMVTVVLTTPAMCNAPNSCDMDYEGNNGYQNLVFTHTYTQPGTYWLKVLFGAMDLDSLQIQVFADTPPTFDMYACGGNQVSYKVTDTNYNQYVVDFNDGSPQVVHPSGMLATGTHTYATSGPKTVTVRGRNLNAQDNCTATDQVFNAVASLVAPTIDRLTVLDQSQIQLEFSIQQFVQYRLEIAVNNASTFQLLQTVYNQSTVTLTNLTPDSKYYCFRLGAYDPCNNTTVYSNIICSSDFDLDVQNNSNNLNWSTANAPAAYFNTIDSYNLLRNSQPSFLILPKTVFSQADVDIVCKTQYCYQHVIRYLNGSESYSMTKCGTAFSTDTPTAVQNVTSVVNGNEATLEWTQDPNYTPLEYSIFRSSDNGGYSLLDKTTIQAYTDPEYSTEASVCYKITYTDQCDNISSSVVEACPIHLSGAVQNDNTITLDWTAYEGWATGVNNYIIEKYNSDGSLLETFGPVSSLTLTDDASGDIFNQVYIYLVKANANDPVLNQSVSNEIRVIKDPNIYYPSAFTPNDDGLNDIFKLGGQYVTGFNMKIFDRWGELLFTSQDIGQGWDGTYRGKPMPEGTYVFSADLTDLAGRTFNRAGSIVLLRKK